MSFGRCAEGADLRSPRAKVDTYRAELLDERPGGGHAVNGAVSSLGLPLLEPPPTSIAAADLGHWLEVARRVARGRPLGHDTGGVSCRRCRRQPAAIPCPRFSRLPDRAGLLDRLSSAGDLELGLCAHGSPELAQADRSERARLICSV